MRLLRHESSSAGGIGARAGGHPILGSKRAPRPAGGHTAARPPACAPEPPRACGRWRGIRLPPAGRQGSRPRRV